MPRMIINNPCIVNSLNINDIWECLKFKAPLISLFASRQLAREVLVGVRVINSRHIKLYMAASDDNRHVIRSELVNVLIEDSKCGPDYGFCETQINCALHTIISKKYPGSRIPNILTAMLIPITDQIVVIHDHGETPWFITFNKSELVI